MKQKKPRRAAKPTSKPARATNADLGSACSIVCADAHNQVLSAERALHCAIDAYLLKAGPLQTAQVLAERAGLALEAQVQREAATEPPKP